MVPCPTCGTDDLRVLPLLPFQTRVAPWVIECFGEVIAADVVERCDRFLEEALELCQALDWPKDRAIALVDYVYGRPKGDPDQEVGGVMVTLAALCGSINADMHVSGDVELARINQPDVIAKIRAKQAAKPTGSALPMAVPRPHITGERLERLAVAIEGECDGLAISEQQASTILLYTLGGEAALEWADVQVADPAKKPARPGAAIDLHRCFICDEPFRKNELVLSDYTEGLGHRACFGEDRANYVNSLDTGEPLGPNDPIPTGQPYDPADYPEYPTLAARSQVDPVAVKVLDEVVAWHRKEIDGLKRQIAENNEYKGRSGFLDDDANNRCRSAMHHHQWSIDAVFRIRSALVEQGEVAAVNGDAKEIVDRLRSVEGSWQRLSLDAAMMIEYLYGKVFAPPASAPAAYPDNLPCDVMLAPETVIRRGCSISTLFAGLRGRDRGDLPDAALRITRSPASAPAEPVAVERLRELLRPFADIADQYDDREDDNFCVCTDSHESDIRDALRLGRLRAIRSTLAEQPAPVEAVSPVLAGWAYEFHEFGDVWKRHVILNRPDGGANPPTKHHGSDIRNVQAVVFAAAPQPAALPVDLPNIRAIYLTTDRRVRHKKRGSTYRVIGEAEAQIATGEIARVRDDGTPLEGTCAVLCEGDILTVYQSEHDGKLWVRFTDEFEDGRFETIADQPLDPEAERCIACDLPLQPDDLVLDDISGGTIHGSCCGPDRESYAYEDGSPLSADAPLPEPWRWGDRLQPKEA